MIALAFRPAFDLGAVERWLRLPQPWAAWIASGLLAALAFLLALGVRWWITRTLHRVAGRTANRVDDLLRDVADATRPSLLLLAAVYLGTTALPLGQRTENALDAGAMLVVLAQVGLWLQVMVLGVLARRAGLASPETPAEQAASAITAGSLGVLGFALRLVLWTLLGLLALDNLGVQITPLITGLGIGGVAVALATQRVLGDLLASLSIELDRPFRPGDFIVVGEFAGTIERIGVKSTRVRSLSGEQVVFPNSDLLDSRIRNYQRLRARRVEFRISLPADIRTAQLRRVPGLLRDAVAAEPRARLERAHFKSIEPGVHVFEVVYFVDDPDYGLFMDIQQAINFAICAGIEGLGLTAAHPTLRLVDARAPADQGPAPERAPSGPAAAVQTPARR